jgi:hypothetical protein
MPRISGETLDQRVAEVWRRLHAEDERAYYMPERSLLGSTLSPACRPAVVRRVRVAGELI